MFKAHDGQAIWAQLCHKIHIANSGRQPALNTWLICSHQEAFNKTRNSVPNSPLDFLQLVTVWKGNATSVRHEWRSFPSALHTQGWVTAHGWTDCAESHQDIIVISHVLDLPANPTTYYPPTKWKSKVLKNKKKSNRKNPRLFVLELFQR